MGADNVTVIVIPNIVFNFRSNSRHNCFFVIFAKSFRGHMLLRPSTEAVCTAVMLQRVETQAVLASSSGMAVPTPCSSGSVYLSCCLQELKPIKCLHGLSVHLHKQGH